jgi:hypothetical protein
MLMAVQITSSWVSPLGRVGYGAKGIVYIIIGYLAAKAAFGTGGQVTGSEGALRQLQQEPFGQVLLITMGLGLAAYALYRLLGAFADVKSEGDDKKALAKRAGYFGSGVAYAALAVAALTGLGGGNGGEQKWTGELLSMPGGRWAVGLIGLAIIAAGIFQWVKAVKGSYRSKFSLDDYTARKRQWVERIAKIGLAARGVVFPIIGWFLIRAAMQSDASETKGIGGALNALGGESYGPWLMGIVAIGLVCYGVYCWVLTIYGTLARPEQ